MRRLLVATLALASAPVAQTFAQATVPSPPATPATAPAAPAASASFELHEWAVFICDPHDRDRLVNRETLFKQTLPAFVGGRRARESSAQATTQPSPVGVITFPQRPGSTLDTATLDVSLEARNGRFLAGWPRSDTKPHRLTWKAIRLAAKDDTLAPVDPGHWYAALRRLDSPFVSGFQAGEQFLLYDVEFTYSPPIKLAIEAEGRYRVTSVGSAPVGDVAVYKPINGGWRAGAIDRLGPSGEADRGEAERVPAEALLAMGPATQSDRGRVVADWVGRLTRAGLTRAEAESAATVLSRCGLDDDRMTVVVRMDGTEMDRLLPLKVTPTPAKAVRVGLLVMRNMDPELLGEIETLVGQLGDDDYGRREAAQRRLMEIGPAVTTRLQAALTDKDAEIAARAEQILDALARAARPAVKPDRNISTGIFLEG